MRCSHRTSWALAFAAGLAGCASPLGNTESRTATVQRTANGVVHVNAPDFETLGFAVAYAHAQDNLCMTADQLVTARGERSRYFGGGSTSARFGLRLLPNEQIDMFVAAHMDDQRLEAAWVAASREAQAQARGYVAGYNRYLADQAAKGQPLPVACRGQAWVKPMTLAEYRRLTEIVIVQAGSGAVADAIVGAAPPVATTSLTPELHRPVSTASAQAAMRERGLLEPQLGSNAWAFGKDSTANGSGLLLGNPHFPWAGVNRFWQMHLTVPGQIDVMGVGLGHGAVVQIGFNQHLAWSHTVSTGKRFTLHELTLVPGDPTSYLLDGQAQKMSRRELTIQVLGADGQLSRKTHTLWSTRWGPLMTLPAAGLNWTAKTAYALQDANTANVRVFDTWLQMARARNVQELQRAMSNQGLAFVNTLAADAAGNALYADYSVVPDVDAAQLARCAPSKPAAALFAAAGLVVLDGAQTSCQWRRDASAPVPGLIPAARLPAVVRSDWVHNSNDSFFHTHPQARFQNISPLVGDASLNRARTRAGLIEIPDMLASGKLSAATVQQRLFGNRNTLARVVLPDLLAACANTTTAAAEVAEGCAALRGWDRLNNLESRGAHLFREFWRSARVIPGVYRVPFDPAQPVATPAGLKMDDAAVAAKVWEALAAAVNRVKAAGFPLDATLGRVQRPLITEEVIPLHGGEDIEGVLNIVGNQFAPGIGPLGLPIDFGTSYVTTVSFDARGPVAHAILTYGQASDPASPFANDQLRLYSRKEWPLLPFHADDVAKARVGEVLRLTRP
jgi:acyl-homoserine-lactone acylase